MTENLKSSESLSSDEKNAVISSEESITEDCIEELTESSPDAAEENYAEADSAPENTDNPDESAEDTAEGEKAVPARSFRDYTAAAEQAVAKFITENNVMARFIGLFMIFSSVVFIKNYRAEHRLRPFSARLGDNYEISGWQDYSTSVSIGKMAAFIGIVFIGISVIRHFIPKLRKINIDGYILCSGVMMFGMSALWRNDINGFFSVFSFGIIAVSLVLLSVFLKNEEFGELKKIPNSVYIVIMVLCAVFAGSFVALTTVYKHRLFHTAVYDLGIFTQMYHSIVTDFTQVTTCERGDFLSHFAVHFSPVYYLLAPFYFFFPSPETLLTAQAVLAVSGFIPVYLICRKYRFSDITAFLFTLVYIFSASVLSPCYYEFHENAFLPPLLMWFFYAIEKENRILMYIMMVLVLMVKEDAALYVMCISLYLVFSGKSRKHGFIMFLLTAAVFINVLSLMAKYGEGAMTNRTFGNLMLNYDGGFGEVIKTALTNPIYFLQQCFADDKLEKFVFIFVMLLPLLFMPFMTRKPSRLLLVVPFLIMNLASGYAYAAKFDFQYVFGTTTCLIYAALINLSDFDRKTVRNLVPLMTAASVLMFTAMVIPKLYYADIYEIYKEDNEKKEAVCASVPDDASLQATPFLLPHCANRRELYILDEGSSVNEDTTDFVIFEDSSDEWVLKKKEMLESEGYTVYNIAEGIAVVYVSPEYKSIDN